MYQKLDKVPVYKEARELLQQINVVSNKLPKSYKYSLGSDIRERGLKLIELIFINLEKEKSKLDIFDMICLCHSLYVNFRIAVDLNLLPKEEYTKVLSKINSVENHLKRWQNK